ncbi:MAG TPA: CoA transferase, partial [Dehalococcoidia bacterium]|nr:CoA transferase [Dehalococcoidia bacterium]
SLLHAYANWNKRSFLLDPADQSTLQRLVCAADIVVSNDPALDYDLLERWHPGVIAAVITPYGLTGPLAGAPGNDLTANALSSWAASQGDPGEPPLKAPPHQVGYLAGLAAFPAILAAVYERDQSGLGQLIDVSELETQCSVAAPSLLVAEYAGAVAPRHKPDMVRGPIPAADGYVSLTISRAQFWRDAMTVLGLHDLAEDRRYAAGFFRQQHRDEYSGRVEERVRGWKRWELFRALSELRCVIGVVQDMEDLAKDPHLRERGFFAEAELPGGVQASFPGAPFKSSATAWSRRLPAPWLGEHTAQIAVEMGLSVRTEVRA